MNEETPHSAHLESYVDIKKLSGCSHIKRLQSGYVVNHILLKGRLDRFIKKSGLSFRKSQADWFSGGTSGYTYAAIIGESSVDIHTWPQNGEVQIKIHVCNGAGKNNGEKTNREKGVALMNMFQEFYGATKIEDFPVEAIPIGERKGATPGIIPTSELPRDVAPRVATSAKPVLSPIQDVRPQTVFNPRMDRAFQIQSLVKRKK